MRYDKEFVKSDGRKLVSGGPRDQQRRLRTPRASYTDQSVVDELRQEIRNLTIELSQKQQSTRGFTAEQVDHEIRKAVDTTVKEVSQGYNEEKKELEKAVKALEANEQRLLKQIEDREKEVVFNKEDDERISVLQEKLNKERTNRTNYQSKLELFENENQIFKEMVDDLKVDKEIIQEKLDKERKLNEKFGSLVEDQTVKIEELTMSLSGLVDGVEYESDRPQMETTFIDPLERGDGEDLIPHIKVNDIKIAEKEAMTSKVNKLRGLMDKLPSGEK